MDSNSVVVLSNAYDVDEAFLGNTVYLIYSYESMSSLKRQSNTTGSLQMLKKQTKKTPTSNANMTC